VLLAFAVITAAQFCATAVLAQSIHPGDPQLWSEVDVTVRVKP
jgi:hypothetical protein